MTDPLLLLQAARASDACLVPEGRIQPDGRLIVSYDGLRISLHRLLWILDGRALNASDFLCRSCQTFGCVHPGHRVRSRVARLLVTCRNGHRYSEEDVLSNGLHRCHLCREARRARARRGGEPNWVRERRKSFCPQGHAYTPDNIYWEITPQGRRKRHCKTCTKARSAGLDPAEAA
jgi:hypothetical protein